MKSETKQVTIPKMPTELWRQLKSRAVERDTTIQAEVNKAIQQYLQQSA